MDLIAASAAQTVKMNESSSGLSQEQGVQYDVSGDGVVNAIDLTLLKRAAFSKNTEECLCENADVNGNHMPDEEDVRSLQDFLLLNPPADTGIRTEMFTKALDGIDVYINQDSILEKGIVNGQNYSLTINLSKWEKCTTP